MNNALTGDEPIKRGPGRPPKADNMRGDRELEERSVTHNRELSDQERIAEFEQKFMESVLPSLPPKDGFHRVWLSTTHPQDTIPGRVRQGYRLLTKADLYGWNLVDQVGTGEYAGCVGTKEMIAAELPEEFFQAYMAINHHKRPMGEEERLKANVEKNNEGAQKKGGRVEVIGEGFGNLAAYVETPDFNDINWRPSNWRPPHQSG